MIFQIILMLVFSSLFSYLLSILTINNLNKIFDTDLIDLQKNLEIVSKLEDNFDGVIWIAGYTGDPENEFNNIELASNKQADLRYSRQNI